LQHNIIFFARSARSAERTFHRAHVPQNATSLTWAMSRYRPPVDAVLLIFAAVGITDLAARRR
jgi:hypothetical protein